MTKFSSLNDPDIVKILDLQTAASLTGAEVIPILQGGVNKKVVISQIQPFVNVKWYGAVGNGITDDTTAIQAAIDAAKTTKQAVYFPTGKYKTTSTLIINDHYLSLIGIGQVSVGLGSDSGSTTYGATIRYYGTGTALLIGLNPGNDGNFIYGTKIENLRIETDNNTSIGMRVWHAAHSRFNNIAIFGMKGSTKIGLKIEAGIDNIYERIDITGSGQTSGANSTEYAIGLEGALGFGNDIATTTVFRRCYFHYCNIAAHLPGVIFDFEDTIFEASGLGVQLENNGVASFTRCWWEANITDDIYFNNANIVINGGRINSYGRQRFFVGNGVMSLSIRDVVFSSTHIAPSLFGPINENTAMSATGLAILSGNVLPVNIAIGGSANRDYTCIQNIDMRKHVYRFKAAGVTGSVGPIDPMLQESGLAMDVYLPENGHFLGVNIYSSGALTGGTRYLQVQKNSVSIASLLQPDSNVQRTVWSLSYYEEKFVKGDLLRCYFATTGLTSTTDFIVEVIVAFGNDGVGLLT